ncbi:hypothetical protein ES708_25530 [subsurface metagenome]
MGFHKKPAVLLHDTSDFQKSITPNTIGGQTVHYYQQGVDPGSDLTLLTFNLTCLQATVIETGCGGAFNSTLDNACKVSLFIDGVQQAEGGFIFNTSDWWSMGYSGNKSVASGVREVSMRTHNYSGDFASVGHMAILHGGCLKV